MKIRSAVCIFRENNVRIFRVINDLPYNNVPRVVVTIVYTQLHIVYASPILHRKLQHNQIHCINKKKKIIEMGNTI